MEIFIIKDENGYPIVKSPKRAGASEAGIDFFVPNNFESKSLCHGDSITIPSGVHVKVPAGKALVFFNKSGVAVNKKLDVGACVVDETYQGQVHINLFASGVDEVVINPGDKIIQGLLLDVDYRTPKEVSSLENLYSEKSYRGECWNGSTGTK